MGNAAIGWRNLADLATISASSFAPLLTPDRLQNRHVARKWRAVANSASLFFDLGSVKDFNSFSLFGLNMTGAGTARIRASATDSSVQANLAYDSTVLAGRIDPRFASFVHLIPSLISSRYVRADLADASLSYLEAGRAAIMEMHEFAANFSPGWEKQWIDLSRIKKSEGRQTFVDANDKIRHVTVTFERITESERLNVIEEIDRENGNSVDVLFVSRPDSDNLGRDSIWGLPDAVTPISQPTIAEDGEGYVYSKTYGIEERR